VKANRKWFLTLVVLLSLALSLSGWAPAQADDDHHGTAAVASSRAFLFFSTFSPGFRTTPWITVLTTKIDAEEGKARALLMDLSMESGIFTNDFRSTPPGFFTFSVKDAVIQAQVLVDGVVATPGVITWDDTFHLVEHATTAADFLVRSDTEFGARAFNFYKIGLADTPKDDHIVQVQVRFFVDAFTFPAGFTFSSAAAAVGTRTLTVQQAKIDLDE